MQNTAWKKKTSDTENARRHTFPFFVFFFPPQKLKEHDDGAGVLSCFGGRQADCKHFEGLCVQHKTAFLKPPTTLDKTPTLKCEETLINFAE